MSTFTRKKSYSNVEQEFPNIRDGITRTFVEARRPVYDTFGWRDPFFVQSIGKGYLFSAVTVSPMCLTIVSSLNGLNTSKHSNNGLADWEAGGFCLRATEV